MIHGGRATTYAATLDNDYAKQCCHRQQCPERRSSNPSSQYDNDWTMFHISDSYVTLFINQTSFLGLGHATSTSFKGSLTPALPKSELTIE
jgi:hypothetical protein